MSELIDEPGKQRGSERLDQAVLNSYLMDHGVIDSEILKIDQYSGGASNLTYRILTDNQDLILRKPPFGYKAKTAHDMQREYLVLSALAPKLSFCPQPLHLGQAGEVMESDFYLMKRIKGVIIRRQMPAQIIQSPELHEAMCREFCDKLVRIHSIDPATVGLATFGKPDGYVERQINGWIMRLEKSKTQNTVPFDDIAAWLREHMPDDCPQASIIHNDFKFDNVVWSQEGFASSKPQIIGVLDWEMSTLGDPLMDLGATLAYWVEADDTPGMLALSMMPTHIEGMMTRKALSDKYLNDRDWSSRSLQYYRIFGLFRLAVIAQQIFYRFDLGQSDNPKFAVFGEMANLLIRTAQAEVA